MHATSRPLPARRVRTLQAVILNKALSLVVVLTALPTRLAAVPLSTLPPHGGVVMNLLLGPVSASMSTRAGMHQGHRLRRWRRPAESAAWVVGL